MRFLPLIGLLLAGSALAQPAPSPTPQGTQALSPGTWPSGPYAGQPYNGVTTTPAATTPTSSSIAVTVQAAAYASGNNVGGLLQFTAVRQQAYIQKIVLGLPDALTPTLDVIFFNANPSGSTITDKSAIAIATADQAKVIGIVHISDCTGYSTPTECQAQNIAMPFALASGTTVYAAIVARSAFTPTGTTWQAKLDTILQ